MPPQNNRQADMQGLNALSILDWLSQSKKPKDWMDVAQEPKDWMDVAQETAAQQPVDSPFGTAGTFAPEESGVWEPGLMSLLPTGPIDLAVETILSGISQDNPKLGIALGLLGPRYGPKIAKGINVGGGAALSRRQYRKGFKQAKSDPMLGEIPFEGESAFVPFTGEFAGRYNPMPGWELMRHGASTSAIGKPFTFSEFTLLDMLNNPALIRRKAMQGTVYHEARHYLQHKAGSPPGAPDVMKYKVFEGVVQKPKNPVTLKELTTPEWVGKLGAEGVLKYKKRLDYLSNPIEVEARLERIVSFGVKNSPSQIADLKLIGYTNKQINSMLKDYKNARRAAFPATVEDIIRSKGITY